MVCWMLFGTATDRVTARVAVGAYPAAFGLFIGPAPTSLDQAGIPWEHACTLVMLRSGQF